MTKPDTLNDAETGPRLLHIFKAGKWTTTAGETIEFSQGDIEATAKAFNPAVSKAPIVVGHPATDDPARGWAQTLTATKRGLFAVPTQVDPVFAEEVGTGRWGTVSSKFYRPDEPNNPVPGVWYLRHIGFLGAQNPAVKGLDDPTFSEADDGCVCFQESIRLTGWDDMTQAGLWRNLREFLISKFGGDDADRVLPNHDVRALELAAQDLITAQRAASMHPTAFAEPAEVPPVSQPPKESSVTEEEAAQLREQVAASTRRVTDLEAEKTAAQLETRRKDNTAFAESMAAEGRILPAHVPQVAAITAQLQASPDVQFGEGDAKKPFSELFQDFLRGLPPMVEFGEKATKGKAAAAGEQEEGDVAFAEGADPERLKQHRAALAYAKEHQCSYAAAAAAVIK